MASFGAVFLVGTTWFGLETATEQHKIDTPPDLKEVVTTVGDESRELIGGAKRKLQREDQAPSPMSEQFAAGERPAN